MDVYKRVRALSLDNMFSCQNRLRSLRNKLPFEDEEFDYVHVQNLALGIPENKVSKLPACLSHPR